MTGENDITFEERQPQPLYMRVGLPILFLVILVWVHFFSEPTSDVLATILIGIIFIPFSILFVTRKLITRVDSKGISIRRRLHVYSQIPFRNIDIAEVASYKKATAEHGSFSLLASGAYFYVGDEGVLIRHHEAKLTFVSSKRADELVDAITSGRRRAEKQRYV